MLPWKHWCLLTSLTLGLVSVTLGYIVYNTSHEDSWPGFLLRTGMAGMCLAVALVAWDIRSMGPADSYSLKSLLLMYVSIKFIMYQGRKWEDKLEKSWKNSSEVQKQSLMDILANASKTKYGRQNNLDKVTSIEEFCNSQPLSTYETYVKYVDDILDGDNDVMFPGKPVFFGTTSGTTGKHKMYPKTEKYFRQLVIYMAIRGFYMLFKEHPKEIRLKKLIAIQTYHEPSDTKISVGKGPVSAKISKHSPICTVPEAGFYLTNTDASHHVNLVFSMRELDVVAISSLFSSSMLGFFHKMELAWKEICDDIEVGMIRKGLNIPEEQLRLLNAELTPNPRRAAELREQCRKGFEGIAKRIWPQLVISFGISTGVFKPAAMILSSKYLKGVINFSRAHVGTEMTYGVNRNVYGDDALYTLLVNDNFYELLPLDSDNTILPQEAEIGKQYELIVTTYEGLYRFRTTDVIEAVGFHGTALVYKFSQRYGDFLNLQNEKTPVAVVEKALQAALRDVMPCELIADFTCAESLHIDNVTGETTATRYWIFVELDSGNVVREAFADKVEEILRSSLPSYANHRTHGTAHPVKVVSLTSGTFKKLRAETMKAKPGTSVEQFKTPRVIREDGHMRIFIDNVHENHR